MVCQLSNRSHYIAHTGRKLNKKEGFILVKHLWDFFASIRLTVVLLISLAATSIIGTLIPQNEDPAAYVQAFGEIAFRLFSLLGIFDMYHSWWFQTLLLMLTINIVVCSVDRLSATWKIIFAKNPSFDAARFKNLKNRETFEDSRSPEQLKKIYPAVLGRAFRYSCLENTEKGFSIFGDKGRWTRLGVYVVHGSVVFLLIGGLIGSIFGFDGFVNIPEGEAVNSIRVGNGSKTLPLDFAIRCDSFEVSFYDSGMPKEYRSSLTIVERGQPVLTKEIIVNDPLRYKGVNMFQSSYGQLPPNEAVIHVTSRSSGRTYSEKAAVGKPIELPEEMGTFVLDGFETAASFRGQNIGEALRGTLTSAAGEQQAVLLPLRFPSFDKMRRGQQVFSVDELKQRFFTGLQVTRDPGVGMVYLGFVLMILGCYVTFFMSHQQICVEVIAKANRSVVVVSGKANKNRMAMQNRVKKLAAKLAGLKTPPKEHSAKGIHHTAECVR
jgi:cytochrome c biogenesis protein